jgi:hypothetical protein
MHIHDNPGSGSIAQPSATLVTGITLILMGGMILLDQYLNTGWLVLMILPLGGLAFLGWGVKLRQRGLITAGGVLTGFGVGCFIAFSNFFSMDLPLRIGFLCVSFALGWGLIATLFYFINDQIAWWTLIPGAIFAGLGMCFFKTPIRPLDFVFYPGVGLGLVLLAWGLAGHLLGLIIPGSLLLGISPGISLAWGDLKVVNSLTQTGVMLVCFALGWGLITIFSRLAINKFIWWPMIPGGIMATTGWGLYIGGNPQHALSFIGNTGSIGLILFGLYILLWNSELRK